MRGSRELRNHSIHDHSLFGHVLVVLGPKLKRVNEWVSDCSQRSFFFLAWLDVCECVDQIQSRADLGELEKSRSLWFVFYVANENAINSFDSKLVGCWQFVLLRRMPIHSFIDSFIHAAVVLIKLLWSGPVDSKSMHDDDAVRLCGHSSVAISSSSLANNYRVRNWRWMLGLTSLCAWIHYFSIIFSLFVCDWLLIKLVSFVASTLGLGPGCVRPDNIWKETSQMESE